MARGLAIAAIGALCVLVGEMSSYEIKVVTAPVIMGESPFWDNTTNTIVFVDIISKLVLRFDPAHPDELKNVSLASKIEWFSHGSGRHDEGRVSPAVPVQGDVNKILVGVGRTLALIDVDWGIPGRPAVLKSCKPLATVEPGLLTNRFNDGKADPQGRLWIGTMDDIQTSRRRRRHSDPNKGELFRFDLEGMNKVYTSKVVDTGLHIPNGMAWTADGKVFYLADSLEYAIFSFDFDAHAGTISNKQLAFRFADYDVPGAPDGLTIDEDGNLWVACVHGGRVIRVDPRTGKLLRTIQLNTTNPSAAEWGGPRRDVLYVTTARYLMDEAQLAKEPQAGCMFAIAGLGTKGRPDVPYAAVSTSRSCGLSHSWAVPIVTVLTFLLSTLNLRHQTSRHQSLR